MLFAMWWCEACGKSSVVVLVMAGGIARAEVGSIVEAVAFRDGGWGVAAGGRGWSAAIEEAYNRLLPPRAYETQLRRVAKSKTIRGCVRQVVCLLGNRLCMLDRLEL